jgi:TonB family protein
MLAVCVAPVGAASPSTTATVPESEKAAPADIGAFSSRLVVVEDGEDDPVARAYEAATRMRAPDSSDAGIREMLDNAVIASTMAYSKFDFANGEFAGTWEFIPPPEGARPTRAWRDIDASSIDGYAAERIGYCKDTREACTAWFDAGRNRSPQPTHSAGSEAHAQWTNRVMEEPCRPGADERPGTSELHRAIRRSELEKATVLLSLLLNACGEARSVSIETSSGSRDVDREAIKWARRARFTSTMQSIGTLGRRGMQGKLPFTFHPAN